MVDVLTAREFVRQAGSAARARSLVAGGAYTRVLRGAYVDAVEDASSPAVRAAALRRVLPAGAALSHRSALWLLGEDVLDRGVLDVTVPRGRHLVSRPGVRVHSAHLPDEELVLYEGQLSVSVARAVVDVARTSSLSTAVAFGDRALRTGTAHLADVERALERAAGLRGVLAARQAVPRLDGRSESWLESVLRMSLYAGGLRGLLVQHDVYDAYGHVGRGDLYLDGAWVECDGMAERTQRPVFVSERRRQTRVLESGHELRRFTWEDVVSRSSRSLAAEVLRAVELAAGRDRSGVRAGPDTLRPPRTTPLPVLAALRRAA